MAEVFAGSTPLAVDGRPSVRHSLDREQPRSSSRSSPLSRHPFGISPSSSRPNAREHDLAALTLMSSCVCPLRGTRTARPCCWRRCTPPRAPETTGRVEGTPPLDAAVITTYRSDARRRICSTWTQPRVRLSSLLRVAAREAAAAPRQAQRQFLYTTRIVVSSYR